MTDLYGSDDPYYSDSDVLERYRRGYRQKYMDLKPIVHELDPLQVIPWECQACRKDINPLSQAVAHECPHCDAVWYATDSVAYKNQKAMAERVTQLLAENKALKEQNERLIKTVAQQQEKLDAVEFQDAASTASYEV